MSSASKTTPNANQPWYAGQGGVTNASKAEGRAFARSILLSPGYRAWLEERVINKTLPPPIESMLWHYGFGKPQENVNVTVSEAEQFAQLPASDMRELAAGILQQLQEVSAREEQLLAEVRAIDVTAEVVKDEEPATALARREDVA